MQQGVLKVLCRYCGELPLTGSLAVDEFVWESATPSARIAAGVGWVAGLGTRLVQRQLKDSSERKKHERRESREESRDHHDGP